MGSVRHYTYAGSIKISREDMSLFRAGQKRCTIRMGNASVASETILVSDGRTSVPVRILRVDNTRCFGDLTDQDALDEGLHSRDELVLDLRKYYPWAKGEDPITVIYFESLDPQQRLL